MMELASYNGVFSGISISGDKSCYQNPLAYARGKWEAYVNLFVAGDASVENARPHRLPCRIIPGQTGKREP
jgi:DUF1680 family protein